MQKITQAAVERAGGCVKVGNALGLTRQAVFLWKQVPAPHVLKVEALSGIPRHLLRPDLYPADRERRPQEVKA
jgi:hypothetical protein